MGEVGSSVGCVVGLVGVTVGRCEGGEVGAGVVHLDAAAVITTFISTRSRKAAEVPA